jgi:hypothetical protein
MTDGDNMKKDFDIDPGEELRAMGAPTFQEFKKNRERWVGRPDDKLAEVDKGGKINRTTQKHIYEIEGFRCKSLEEVERVARSQGIPIKDLDYKPEVMPNAGHKHDLLVKFMPKSERDRRKDW